MRILSVVLSFFLAILMSSCLNISRSSGTESESPILQKDVNEIVTALENRDKVALKSMFSLNALKEAKNIDAGLTYVMNFYKGTKKSVDGGLFKSSDASDHGSLSKTVEGEYRVTTDYDEYLIYFVDQVVDTEQPDNVGLYMLQVILAKDRQTEMLKNGRVAGIYTP